MMKNALSKILIVLAVLAVTSLGQAIAATEPLKQKLGGATDPKPTVMSDPVASQTTLENVALMTPAAPPFKYYAAGSLQSSAIRPLALRLIRSSANNITDEEQWLESHDLKLPTYTVANPFRNIAGNVPRFIPGTFKGQLLVKAIRYPNLTILLYGANFGENRYLIAVDAAGKYLYGFDFIHYSQAPDFVESDKEFIQQKTVWAFDEGDILYVSHGHNTYASSSMGLNAYITALEKTTGKVLWRTQPLVSNATNFEVIGDTIIAGYGFTDEPDYLYLINKKTGEVYDQIKLKSGPDYIVLKGATLYVRTYNTDYQFAVEGL